MVAFLLLVWLAVYHVSLVKMRTEDETMYYVEEGLRVIVGSLIAALCLLLYLIAIREREILIWAGICVALL